ncbi:MAG: hypothetical protein GXO93_07085 [FCB group bacterium]|nr:hypothetical protein [FCB group bacterium]
MMITPFLVKKYLAPLFILLLVIVMSACNKDVSNSDNTHYDIDSLLAAPTSVNINGRQFELSPYLWRDFMPVSPIDGKPMIALMKIFANDSLPLPSSLTPDSLWIINGKRVWATTFSKKEQRFFEDHLESIARNGPKWGPGIKVDVVIRLKDNDNIYYLKATDVTINRTD